MPAQNAQQPASLKRSLPSRVVVPVVPLTPKTARPLSKHDASSRATTTPASSTGARDQLPNDTDHGRPLSNSSPSAAQPNGNVVESAGVALAAEEQAEPTSNHTSDEPNTLSAGSIDKLANGAPPQPSQDTSHVDGAARKATDKFDMRQIRTELPPAFVPAAGQNTPQSASSSQARQHHPVLPHAHPTHPSAGSIVFGGHESASSSPAPPMSANSAFAPPLVPAQTQVTGHSHHSSESFGQRTNAHAYQQQPVPWQMRPGPPPGMPQPFYHPHAHMPMRYPPREAFTPAAHPMPNGHGLHSRSSSRGSSAPYDARRPGSDLQSPIAIDQTADPARTMFSGPPRHLPPQHPQHMMPPPNFNHPEMAMHMENAELLREHVLSQLKNPELADCHLQVSEQEGQGRQYLEGHKLVLARSPTLWSIIRQSEAPAAAALKTQVHVQLKGKHVRVGPFMDAVRYLYGGPLPPFDAFAAPSAPADERMDLALQHIATGAWLSIPAFAHRGVEIAATLLNWETMPLALGFALKGGLAPTWPIEDGSEEKISTCSSDDSFTKPEAGGSPTYDPFSSGLLHRAIEFTVQHLPPNFYLDSTASQLATCPRLPVFQASHESKSSQSDPRLSKIRFGEITVDDHQRPSFSTTVVSSILLSLPFPLLKFLLEHPVLSNRLGPETVASIMRQVVGEREVRRQKALNTRTVNRTQGNVDSSEVQNLFWEEVVELYPQNRAGFRLARRRRGIDTPPSSGNES